MSFEYTVDKGQAIKKLSAEQQGRIVSDISKKFETWDQIRQHQVDMYRKLKPEIYLEDRAKKDTWKSQTFLNKVYSLYQTRQAFIWENVFANLGKMFDVEGRTPEADKTAKQQKASLIDAFDKMRVSQQLDKAIEYLDSVGEMCLFTGWKKKYKRMRRSLSFMEQLKQGKIIELLKGETSTGIFEEVVHNGAYVEAINPLNLVFDTVCVPEIQEQWDRAGKIIKSFKTYDEIASNKVYDLNKSDLSEIHEMIQGKSTAETAKNEVDKRSDTIDDNKIEVLEYWGDYEFDGITLKNYVIVVIGRKYMARFIENPFLINPIVNVATMRNPDSHRGIPCLASILDIAKVQERDVNEAEDAKQLNKNPVRLAPEGFFKKKETEAYPGLLIEYNPVGEDPRAIIPISVPLMNAETQIQYLDKIASDVSGIFPNMQGQDEKGDKTATELKIKVSGQTTRLSKDLDAIKQNGIVQMVRNVADLMANEKTGKVERIFVKEAGESLPIDVDDTIRQGEYDYKYSDSSALAVKKSQYSEALELFKWAASDPALSGQINKRAVFEEGLEIIGLENTEKFFMPAPMTEQPTAPMQLTPTQQTEAINGQDPRISSFGI